MVVELYAFTLLVAVTETRAPGRGKISMQGSPLRSEGIIVFQLPLLIGKGHLPSIKYADSDGADSLH